MHKIMVTIQRTAYIWEPGTSICTLDFFKTLYSLYSATENLHSFIVLTLGGASWSKERMLSSDRILPPRVEHCNQIYARSTLIKEEIRNADCKA